MATLVEIYEWFMTGKKPTQAQFWASWGSFWNKSEQIPQSSISGLPGVLNAKAEKAQFDAHKTDENAHADLFDAKADAQALLNHIQATFEAIGIELQSRVYGDESLQFQIDDTNDFVSQARSDIEAINTLLTSNDINLDTVQEIVDAIKTVETSLSTILVNDLTTGGATKALTAEMGKTLKGLIDGLNTNKVDKVAGERLINAAEITKLAGVTNVTTTVKTITSASLATQDVAGFVAYINALAVVLVVGANEIVEYQLSDTGRLFKLLLRGRSFGVGQAAIVAADVEEVTLWMQKDLKLSNYPNTRDDGSNPTNKVLSTDASGNLKMYSMTGFPAPYLSEMIPDSNLPSTTFNILLKGDFFTPNMTIAYAGQTVVSKTFISSKEYRITLTTGSAEGMFNITLNNGVSITYPNAFLVVLGTTYIPVIADFINVGSTLTVFDGKVTTNTVNVLGSTDLNLNFDMSKKWRLYVTVAQSPLTSPVSTGVYNIIEFRDTTTLNLGKITMEVYPTIQVIRADDATTRVIDTISYGDSSLPVSFFLDWNLSALRVYSDTSVLLGSFAVGYFGANFAVKFNLKNKDIKSIKYVLLPM